jgi:hypothetical protein
LRLADVGGAAEVIVGATGACVVPQPPVEMLIAPAPNVTVAFGQLLPLTLTVWACAMPKLPAASNVAVIKYWTIFRIGVMGCKPLWWGNYGTWIDGNFYGSKRTALLRVLL